MLNKHGEHVKYWTYVNICIVSLLACCCYHLSPSTTVSQNCWLYTVLVHNVTVFKWVQGYNGDYILHLHKVGGVTGNRLVKVVKSTHNWSLCVKSVDFNLQSKYCLQLSKKVVLKTATVYALKCSGEFKYKLVLHLQHIVLSPKGL